MYSLSIDEISIILFAVRTSIVKELRRVEKLHQKLH